jgi:signal transduction histidine kinase
MSQGDVLPRNADEPRILQFPRRTGAAKDVDDDADDIASLSSSRMLRRALCAVTPIITSAHDESFLSSLVHELVAIFQASRGSVMLLDVAGVADSPLRLHAASGLPDLAVRRESYDDGVAARVLRDARPTLIFDRADRDARFFGLAMRDEVGAAMCVPIATPTGTLFGVLNVARERGAACAGFTRSDLEVCDAIAMLVGDALERLQSRRAEADLRERLRAVERLSMMGEVAAGIAHEIATPMACVRTNLVTLLRYLDELAPFMHVPADNPMKETADDVPVLLGDIREGVERAEQVMQRMKKLARLERGAHADFAVGGAVDAALRLVRPRLRAGVVIDVRDDLRAHGCDVDLIQVLVNLLVNADDAIAQRQAHELTHGRRGRPGEINVQVDAVDDVVVVDVSDNGTGIAAVDLHRVFMPLFTTKQNGTGLGLSLSRRLVEEQGGRLSVTSTVDVGSTFRVVLPRT